MADTVVVLGDIGTGVDDIAQAGSPLVFGLAGARPNPFRLNTTLCFSLPVPQHVRLSVFDLAGRRVRVLVDEACEAGRHEVAWDGRDAAGRALASGIYFVQLQGEERSLTGRIVRVK
jgi:hypothetical protein